MMSGGKTTTRSPKRSEGDGDPPKSPPLDASAGTSEKDLDDTYRVFREAEQLDFSEEDAKRVRRKIDLHVVPILIVTYALQYLDKNSINFANAFGLQEGTNLTGQDYSWLGSIFYFGYLISQFPSAYLIQRLPVGRFVSLTTIAWGIILLTTPACTSFAGMATNRFLLGFFEAAVNPGFVFIMSLWYTASEQPLRLEAYYCTNGIATMFGGLVGYAVGNITTGLPQWMYVFLIFGAISFLQGFISLIWLPDLPSTARFLNPTERAIAIERVSRNKQGVKNQHFKTYQAMQCVRDREFPRAETPFISKRLTAVAKTWILFVMAVGAQIPNSALTSFSSQIIKGFGFDALGTQYMQIPGGAVQFLTLIAGGYICTHWPGMRCITMTIANLICIAGAALLVGLPERNKVATLLPILCLTRFSMTVC